MTLRLDGELWTVLDFLHHKPGKGQAVVRTKLRNVKSGNVLDRTFRHDEKVGLSIVEKRDMQNVYRVGESFVFMDTSTYDQATVASTRSPIGSRTIERSPTSRRSSCSACPRTARSSTS